MSTLGDLVSPDVARDALLVVPLGATEQHGPHLPLSTDTDIARALAQRLADAVPGAIVAPPLSYGASGEHQGFAGTLSIGQEAVELVLVELCRSATETFERVLLVSGHGGNAEPVARAVARLRGEGRDVRAWSPSAVWRGDAHAGHVETSVMLALDPARVGLERAAAGNTGTLAELLPAMRRGGVRAVSENGVLGDPAGASAEAGRALLDAATDELAAWVGAWHAARAVDARVRGQADAERVSADAGGQAGAGQVPADAGRQAGAGQVPADARGQADAGQVPADAGGQADAEAGR